MVDDKPGQVDSVQYETTESITPHYYLAQANDNVETSVSAVQADPRRGGERCGAATTGGE